MAINEAPTPLPPKKRRPEPPPVTRWPFVPHPNRAIRARLSPLCYGANFGWLTEAEVHQERKAPAACSIRGDDALALPTPTDALLLLYAQQQAGSLSLSADQRIRAETARW